MLTPPAPVSDVRIILLETCQVAQWKTQACATGGVKKFQLFYQVRLHLRPNENDLAAVKLTYLQVRLSVHTIELQISKK